MDTITMSFSQNKEAKYDNSSKIANGIKKLSKNQVRHIKINDYDITPCSLCGDCAKTQTCLYDKAFNRLTKDIGNPDMIYMVVPYYSPVPSKLMVLLEKLNQIFYSSWIIKNPKKHDLVQTHVGLIVHGGMIDSEEVKSHYKTMMNTPLAFTLKNLQFKVIEDDNKFKNGLAFGIEDKDKIYMVDHKLFPDVIHNSDYIETQLKQYVELSLKKLSAN